MTDPATVEVLTSDEAEAAQRRAAGALAARGLSAGDRIAFALPSSSGLLTAVLGALRTGVVPVLLNATLLASERDELVADARPSLVITEPDDLAELGAGPPVDLAPFPLARPMHYTSGTTGRSKGVWSGLWDEATARASFTDEAELWSFGLDDVHLVCSPMYHSVSVRFAAGTLLSGGTVVILSHFDAAMAGRLLSGADGPVPTTTFMAPAALQRLLASPTTPDRLESLRLLVHAGSPCPPTLKQAAFERVAPGVLWEFYGSTEGQFTVCPPEEWMARPGTVGKARPGRSVSVDDDGTIWCRPPAFARFEYWDDGDKTATAWRDGSFTVGDLGRLDADGYLYIDGRRHDLIITGGVNVYPAEVEAVLADVAGVAEIAVFGVEDEHWGQRVCAAVVPDGGGGRDPDRLVAAVGDRARVRLAGYKRPKQIVVLDQLPRTATGKLQRFLLAGTVGTERNDEGGAGPAGPSRPVPA